MFRPLNDCVVIEPVKTPEKLVSGLALPDSAKNNYHGLRGVVVAVGPGAWTISGERLTPSVAPGDVVVLAAPGRLVRDESGRVYSIVCDRDVLAVVEDPGEVRTYDRCETGALLADD